MYGYFFISGLVKRKVMPSCGRFVAKESELEVRTLARHSSRHRWPQTLNTAPATHEFLKGHFCCRPAAAHLPSQTEERLLMLG